MHDECLEKKEIGLEEFLFILRQTNLNNQQACLGRTGIPEIFLAARAKASRSPCEVAADYLWPSRALRELPPTQRGSFIRFLSHGLTTRHSSLLTQGTRDPCHHDTSPMSSQTLPVCEQDGLRPRACHRLLSALGLGPESPIPGRQGSDNTTRDTPRRPAARERESRLRNGRKTFPPRRFAAGNRRLS